MVIVSATNAHDLTKQCSFADMVQINKIHKSGLNTIGDTCCSVRQTTVMSTTAGHPHTFTTGLAHTQLLVTVDA